MLDCMNPYLTSYHRDYRTWEIREIPNYTKWRNFLIKNSEEFQDPIRESFKNYLCLEEPCPPDTLEKFDSFFEKGEKKYKGVTKNFQKPLDKETIKKVYIYQGRTEYQVTYCDLIKEVEEKELRRKNAVKLPLDTKIPLTSNLASHREPRMINSRVYQTRPVVGSNKPSNNLDPDHKIREILNTKTGNTEYMEVIGKLGKKICAKQYHGIIPLL